MPVIDDRLAEPVNAPSASGEVMRRDYLAGGPRALGTTLLGLGTEDSPFDAALNTYGLRLLDVMLNDPKVGATINTIKCGVLADGIQINPAVMPRVGDDGDLDDQAEADVGLAKDIAEFCGRAIDRLKKPLEMVLFELMDAMVYGSKLAEVTYELGAEGPDAGQLTLASVKVKPQWAWGFLADRFGNVLGIVGAVAQGISPIAFGGNITLGTTLLPREKFLILSWHPRDDDPRGRTIMRSVYDPWFRKFQTLQRYDTYLDKFANPLLVGMLAEGQHPRGQRDASGRVTQVDIPPEQDMLDALTAAQGASAIVTPYGGDVKAIHPNGEGSAFVTAIELLDKQIVYAIAQNTRAIEEATYGSRADSETSQDIMGLVIRQAKQAVRHCVREDVLRPLVMFRYGKGVADRLTPIVSLGMTEHQDFSRNAGAVARLAAAGLIDESQVPAIMAFLGLPAPKPGAKKIGASAQPGPADGAGNAPPAPVEKQPPAAPARQAA